MVVALIQAAAEIADPTLWAWVQLIGAWLIAPGTLAFGFALYHAYRKGQLLRFIYQMIEGHKKAARDAGEPLIARELTAAIATGLESMPALKRTHAKALKSAAVNLEAILGPAIADQARREGDPNDPGLPNG